MTDTPQGFKQLITYAWEDRAGWRFGTQIADNVADWLIACNGRFDIINVVEITDEQAEKLWEKWDE